MMIGPSTSTPTPPPPPPPPPPPRHYSSNLPPPLLLAVAAGGPSPHIPVPSSPSSSAPSRASHGTTDENANLLLELRRPSDDGTSSPILAPPSEHEDGRCLLTNCLLCSRGVPGLLIRSPTWASIMRVVFYCLQSDNTTKQFFNLKTDVYGFMTTHWTKLCLDKKRSDNWHKQIQDMLSHSKNLFESGMEKYRQNGFWRMKQTQDPWTIRKDKKSPKLPSKRIGESSDSIGSPKRRKTEDASDDESGSDSEDSKKGLEDEVRHLKEELKKKEQEAIESKYLYFKLAEQIKMLQQQNELLVAAARKQQQQQHMQQQVQQPQQAPVQPPAMDPQRMNPKQWDASYPQPWEALPPQQDAARKALMGSAPGIPLGSPKWDEHSMLRFSASMYPLHFNFPFTSPSAKMDDSSALRLNPLASI